MVDLPEHRAMPQQIDDYQIDDYLIEAYRVTVTSTSSYAINPPSCASARSR
jgi:hypothetical protein